MDKKCIVMVFNTNYTLKKIYLKQNNRKVRKKCQNIFVSGERLDQKFKRCQPYLMMHCWLTEVIN